MPQSQPDYYSVLGIFRDATQEEIKQAYFEAAQRLHPDRNTAAGETELFLDVQQAYETLANPKRRSQYDLTLPPEAIAEKNKFVCHTIQYSRPNLVHIKEDQLLYVLMEIEPSERQSGSLPAPPLNICLVLDRLDLHAGREHGHTESQYGCATGADASYAGMVSAVDLW